MIHHTYIDEILIGHNANLRKSTRLKFTSLPQLSSHNMHDEFDEEHPPASSFQTYSAEGDHLAKSGNYKQAVESYTNALHLRPNDRACLVFRSRCYLLMGDASSALNDANASLAGLYFLIS
jgi:tetratricopeptide (TPR) repeat protein